jgi:hypothetical protein
MWCCNHFGVGYQLARCITGDWWLGCEDIDSSSGDGPGF